MINISFENDLYIITVTYSYYLFFTKRIQWYCTKREDLKKFIWIFDSILRTEPSDNDKYINDITLTFEKTIDDCIKYNNIVQDTLFNNF
jgi:hypothetical protein